VDDSEIQIRSVDEVGLENLNSAGIVQHACDGGDHIIKTKPLAFLAQEIVGGLN